MFAEFPGGAGFLDDIGILENNIDCMKKMFLEFNSRLAKVLGQGFEFVDGSKFQA